MIRGLLIASMAALALLSVSPAQGDTLELSHGWNLVSWSAETTLVDAALDGDTVSTIYGWDNDTQRFSRYFPNNPALSTITHLDTGEAYWVLALAPGALSPPSVAPQCPEASPCPTCTESTPCPECPVGYDWECTEVRQHAMEYESYLKFCETNSMGFECTYEKEELAAAEAYLDAYCR